MRKAGWSKGFALAVTTLASLWLVNCDDSSTSDGGSIEGGACSSCQESYTAENCSTWGALAGCETSATSTQPEDVCSPDFTACTFTQCAHRPICADDGAATCFDCDKPTLTAADCEAMSTAANCDSFELIQGTACDKAATGCSFLGCDFAPC